MTSTQSGESLQALLARAGGMLRAGQPAAALQLAREALSRQLHPDLLKVSGMALAMLGRAEEAEAALRERLGLVPDSIPARSDLANVLLTQGRNEEALELLESAPEPIDDPAARFNLARAMKGSGRPAEAVPLLEQLLEAQPNHTGALITLADCCKALGEADRAAALIRKAIALNPANGMAWWSLSNLKSGGFSGQELEQLKQSVQRPQSPSNRMYFEFALGRALEEAGDLGSAFDHYAAGNQLKHREQPWDRAGFRHWLAQLEQASDAIDIPGQAELDQAPRPLFIVSLPRSGSTLVEQILAAHPQVTAASELPWIPRIIAGESARRKTGITRWLEQADPATWQQLGEEYLEKSAWWQREGRSVFTDKLPGNFPYTLAILKMLPQALVVNVRRNARDVCWSCYRQLFISGSEFAYDLQDLAAYWTDHQQAMQRWQQRLPGRILNLDYEKLVGDPEPEVRRLLEFAGLPWSDDCLRFYEARRAVNTASASQVRQKINQKGVGHWQRYEQQLQPLLDALESEAKRVEG